MAERKPAEFAKTVLHDWHVNNGGKMVEFGGWDMPVQYKTGIIREHLATRRNAGLFDVSHMGRFRFKGAGAQNYLLYVLTNNANSLDSGQAQYTFIANDTGGAVDDTYLYKLARDDFLLVVNAANRGKDWKWLHEHNSHPGVEMIDSSDQLAMISLQGPNSSSILEQVVSKKELPENKRNRLSVVAIDGYDVMVARTGYTGESVCFELFLPTAYVAELWQRLVDMGATPAGLGARDSLRLEAGLPLYGHELGLDPEQQDIPIFANDLARFGVRVSDQHEYIGRPELEKQREELIQIKRGELATPADARLLKRIVQPIAVFGGRRPLRAGFKVYHEDEHVGYVTSGTTVPFSHFYGKGITAMPTDEHDLRPIGLALIDSFLRYRADRPILLQIADERGNTFDAELVEKNMWPVAPYGRAYRGFTSPKVRDRVDPNSAASLAAKLMKDSDRNTEWRRKECINLIPSEQTTSEYVDRLSAADPSGRYNEHKHIKALGPDSPDVRYYKGTEFIMEKEEELKAALRTFFNCLQVEARVISGQMANDTVYDALKQFKNRHTKGKAARLIDRVLVHDLNKGGHLSAQIPGALKNYVAIDPHTERAAVEHFPFRKDNPYRIDVDETKRLIVETRPDLLVFGRSVIIQKEPVKEIADFIHSEYGKDNPQRPFIMYDGAHVLGLLGEYFQDPLKEGADVVTGSTHKTYFGPQRGVILSNIEPGSAFEELWRFVESRTFPGHVSNHHLGTLLGFLGATYEMLCFKHEYPRQVVENAKAFAKGLHEQGLVLEGESENDFTETHQVLLRGPRTKGEYLSDLLETNNIITNPQAFYDDLSFAAASGVRMGSQEMTRHGMKPSDFENLAGLMAEIVSDGQAKPEAHWAATVKSFRSNFSEMRYCF